MGNITNDITAIFSKQLSQLCRVTNFLQEHREHNQRNVDLNIALLQYLKDVCFYIVENDRLYKAQIYPEKSTSAKMCCKCNRVDDAAITALTISDRYNDESFILTNTDTIMFVYSEVLIEYYNSVCVNSEPTFGMLNRQIPFAPLGATMNKAWWERFKYQYMISMDTFAKLVTAPCAYSLGPIRSTVVCRFIYDSIGVDFSFDQTDTIQKVIEP